jgi:two-component system, OmpR family, KDP operon response regulator KdpE
MHTARILLATDMPASRLQLRDALQANGYTVLMTEDGTEAIAVLGRERPDLIVLNLTLSGMDGFETLRAMRRVSATPVILLAPEGRAGGVLRGFASGADDYLTTPCNPAELAARVRAVLARVRAATPPARRLCYPGVDIDLERRTVTVDGVEVHTTATEWALLALLGAHAGTMMRHSELLWPIWGPEHGANAPYLRTWISRIRSKVERSGAAPLITTYPGVGYRLAAPPKGPVGLPG